METATHSRLLSAGKNNDNDNSTHVYESTSSHTEPVKTTTNDVGISSQNDQRDNENDNENDSAHVSIPSANTNTNTNTNENLSDVVNSVAENDDDEDEVNRNNEKASEPESPTTTIKDDKAKVEETHVCWICYESDSSEGLVSPCVCKGTMQYAHQSCLLQWLEQSGTEKCPHCHHDYTVDKQYTSVWHKWFDHPYVPYILATLVIVAAFYAFHLCFSRVLRALQTRKTNLTRHSNTVASMMHRPEMIGLLRTTLPLFHPVFSLVMNGIQSNSTTFSLTLLFAEFELFAFLVATLFSLSHYAYKLYTRRTTDNDSDNVRPLPTTLNHDVHEGMSNTDDGVGSGVSSAFASNAEEDVDSDGGAVQDVDETMWDVANRFWTETNIGSRQTLTEDAVYLFPFDVMQTAFNTLHHYGKQQQNIYINKKVIIQSASV